VAGRASIVGAAATHVGKVREHNEDAHFFDEDAGLFVVCDGMGGHAAGEVASNIAIQTIRVRWSANEVRNAIDAWLARGTPDARKQMLAAIREGARAAHDAILAEAAEDEAKSGMGTTLVGALIVGNELVFAHAGDSRAYIVRDNIAMQLTEDHTLLSRLLAAGIDVDVSGEGSRFRSMLTNALGIGQECKVSTFVVPLADGDRFLLCSDGISEYVPEPEVGTVLTGSPSPARAAQKLIDLALERGGGDNATAVVIRVLEAGETPQPVELRRRDDTAIQSCALWDSVSPQQRLRALRIAIERDVGANERLPAHTLGERVAWIIVDGVVERGGKNLGPGALLYPESLIRDSAPPDRESLAITRSDVRGLVLRADDFYELCEDDPELAELLHERLGKLVSRRGGLTTQSEETDFARMKTLDPDRSPDRPQEQPTRPRSRAETSELAEPPPPVAPPLPITLPEVVVPLTKVKEAVPIVVDEIPTLSRQRTPATMQRATVEELQATPVAGKKKPTPVPKPAPQPIARIVTVPTKKEPKPIPSLVNPGVRKTPPPPPPAGAPKPVAAEASPDIVDLGSELRADLGGEHAVPKRRPSAPKIETRAQTAPPIADAELEVEMETVVEMEAEPPPDDDELDATATETEEQGVTVELIADAPDEQMSPDDDDEADITVTVESDDLDDSVVTRADTQTDVVVTGTIKIEGQRSKRISDGWGGDD
jgi:serine/threonine protein phosphatase PrpC